MRALAVVVALIIACGPLPKPREKGAKASNNDETAAEYQRRKAKESGELDEESASGKWGGWKYQGERDTCRFVLGRRCFTKQESACKAAKCKTKCQVDGGGPATVSCSKT